jgi:hypothetical protein
MSIWPPATMLAEGAISLLMAIMLIVAGILILRQSAVARKLHLIYATVKIPLAIVGGIAYAAMMSQLVGGMGAAAGAAGTSWAFSIMGVALAVIGSLYPIALLITMNTRTVRDYYNSVRGERG